MVWHENYISGFNLPSYLKNIAGGFRTAEDFNDHLLYFESCQKISLNTPKITSKEALELYYNLTETNKWYPPKRNKNESGKHK